MLKNLMRQIAAQEALKPAAPEVPVTKPKRVKPTSLRAMARASSAMVRLHAGLASITAAAESFEDLRLIARTLEAHGMSKPVMTIVNHKNRLSTLSASVPSTESLNIVPTSAKDFRNQAVVKDLRAALEGEDAMMQSWLTASADDIATLLASVHEQTEEYGAIIEGLRATLASGTVADAALAAVVATTLSAAQRATTLQVLAAQVAGIEAPEYDAGSAESLTNARQVITAALDAVKPFTGAQYDGDYDAVVVNAEAISDEFKPSEGSLLDKGYTIATTVELLDAAAALAGVLKALADKSGAIVERLKGVAATYASEPSPAVAAPAEPVIPAEPVADPVPAAVDPAMMPTAEPPAEPAADPAPIVPVEPAPVVPVTEPEPEPETVPAIGQEELETAVDRGILSAYVGLLLLLVEASLAAITDTLAVADDVAEQVSTEPMAVAEPVADPNGEPMAAPAEAPVEPMPPMEPATTV